MPAARRFEKSSKITPIIATRIESREAGKALVGGKAMRMRARCKTRTRRRHNHRLGRLHATPQNADRGIGAVAHPDFLRKPTRGGALKQPVANARQHMHMLVPVDKGRRTTVMLAESIELGGNLGADLGLRQAA